MPRGTRPHRVLLYSLRIRGTVGSKHGVSACNPHTALRNPPLKPPPPQQHCWPCSRCLGQQGEAKLPQLNTRSRCARPWLANCSMPMPGSSTRRCRRRCPAASSVRTSWTPNGWTSKAPAAAASPWSTPNTGHRLSDGIFRRLAHSRSVRARALLVATCLRCRGLRAAAAVAALLCCVHRVEPRLEGLRGAGGGGGANGREGALHVVRMAQRGPCARKPRGPNSPSAGPPCQAPFQPSESPRSVHGLISSLPNRIRRRAHLLVLPRERPKRAAATPLFQLHHRHSVGGGDPLVGVAGDAVQQLPGAVPKGIPASTPTSAPRCSSISTTASSAFSSLMLTCASRCMPGGDGTLWQDHQSMAHEWGGAHAAAAQATPEGPVVRLGWVMAVACVCVWWWWWVQPVPRVTFKPPHASQDAAPAPSPWTC
jgi:hypothetical protein